MFRYPFFFVHSTEAGSKYVLSGFFFVSGDVEYVHFVSLSLFSCFCGTAQDILIQLLKLFRNNTITTANFIPPYSKCLG